MEFASRGSPFVNPTKKGPVKGPYFNFIYCKTVLHLWMVMELIRNGI